MRLGHGDEFLSTHSFARHFFFLLEILRGRGTVWGAREKGCKILGDYLVWNIITCRNNELFSVVRALLDHTSTLFPHA